MINSDKKSFLSFSIDRLLSRDVKNTEDNSTKEEETDGTDINTIEATESSGDITKELVGKLNHSILSKNYLFLFIYQKIIFCRNRVFCSNENSPKEPNLNIKKEFLNRMIHYNLCNLFFTLNLFFGF